MNISARALRYSAFAFVATLANVASQWLMMQLYLGSQQLTSGMLVGTGVGLVTKYLLDKKWIFFDPTTELRAYSRQFSQYALTGVITTIIFWLVEVLFYLALDHPSMKYIGAIVGLSLGYTIKYELDRRFVFRSAPA